MVNLTPEQTTQLIEFVKDLHAKNWGMWPDASVWPDFGVAYTAFQEDAGQGRHLTIVKFDEIVKPHGYRGASRRWAAGPGGRRMRDTMGLGF